MTRGLNLPGLLTTTPEEVANDIYKGFKKGRNLIYTRWYWRWVMFVIRIIPESIFKRLSL